MKSRKRKNNKQDGDESERWATEEECAFLSQFTPEYINIKAMGKGKRIKLEAFFLKVYAAYRLCFRFPLTQDFIDLHDNDYAKIEASVQWMGWMVERQAVSYIAYALKTGCLSHNLQQIHTWYDNQTRTPFSPGTAVGAGVRPTLLYNPLDSSVSDKTPSLPSKKDAYMALYPDLKTDYRREYRKKHGLDDNMPIVNHGEYVSGLNSYARVRLAAETPEVQQKVEAYRQKEKAKQIAAADPLTIPSKPEDLLARSQRFSL